jgi:phage shock protein A
MAKANPFVRSWKYFSAWFGAKVDERADPKIQIQQAIEDAQHQHEELTKQAANVIGNQRQLEMRLNRQLGQIESLQAQTRQALVLADKAQADGDAAKAGEFEQTAQALANQLVGAEQSVQDLKVLHDQSLQAAQQAREAVQSNSMMLQEKLTERSKLLSQLEQAKMQEQVSASLTQMSEMAAPRNVPTLDEVRDKIEKRYAVALGQADLAQSTMGGRILDVKRATIDLKGAGRLEEIRASLAAEQHAALASATTPSQASPATEPAAVEAPQAPIADGMPQQNAQSQSAPESSGA